MLSLKITKGLIRSEIGKRVKVTQVAERQRTIRMVGRDGTSARLNVKNLMGGTIIDFVVATSSDGYRT